MKFSGRKRRHKRITKNMQGSSTKPRLAVFRSRKHIYAQLIDDSVQKVIAGFSTLSKEFKDKHSESSVKKVKARQIGKLFAQKVLSKGIKEVCFDRGGYKYHGRLKELADGAREGGLKF